MELESVLKFWSLAKVSRVSATEPRQKHPGSVDFEPVMPITDC